MKRELLKQANYIISTYTEDDIEKADKLRNGIIEELEKQRKITKPCPYCSSENESIRSTYFDQMCYGCYKRMTA